MVYQLFLITGVILLYLFLFYAFGSVALHIVSKQGTSLSCTMIIGFFAYHFLFSVLTLPMKVLLCPLSWLSAAWAAVLVLVCIVFLILERNSFPAHLQSLRMAFTGKQLIPTLILLGLILLQVIWFNLNDETYAIWDQSYYLGDTATSLYTNTISQYNPYTGRILDFLNSEYLLETYQNHGSVMCQLLHLHPMVEVLTVMASVVIMMYQLIAWEFGLFLFHGNRLRSAVLVFFLFLLNIFSYNLYTAAEFLIIRPSEGKTVLAVLILPALLLFFLKTAANPENRMYWYGSFLIILGSFGLNMSAIFMIPFELTALYLPLAVHKKKWFIFVRYVILMLPCILMSALYLLTKNKFLIYTGK